MTHAPPRQPRSERTLAKIADATGLLLEERAWSEITLQEILREAGVSVGSFYARFSDKEALIDYLDQRYATEVIEGIGELSARISQADGFDAAAREMTTGIAGFYRRQPALVRALVLRARSGTATTNARTISMTEKVPELLRALCAHLPNDRQTLAGASIARAFAVAHAALREQILFPGSLGLDIDIDLLIDDLVAWLSHCSRLPR